MDFNFRSIDVSLLSNGGKLCHDLLPHSAPQRCCAPVRQCFVLCKTCPAHHNLQHIPHWLAHTYRGHVASNGTTLRNFIIHPTTAGSLLAALRLLTANTQLTRGWWCGFCVSPCLSSSSRFWRKHGSIIVLHSLPSLVGRRIGSTKGASGSR